MKKGFIEKTNATISKRIIIAAMSWALIASWGLSAQEAIVFKNVNLVPMTEDKVIPHQTVIVKGNRIEEISPASSVAIPAGARVIDGTGKYLMPGLADMHVHVEEYDPVSPLLLFLANGVTTIRSFDGDRGSFILKWRDDIRRGTLDGPAIYTCGSVLNHFLQDLPAMVQDQKKRGYDFIKIYSYVQPRGFADAMKIAHELGMYSVGHIPFAVGLDGVLAGGMNEIAHVEEIIFSELSPFNRTQTFMPDEWQQLVFGAIMREFSTPTGFHVEEVVRKKTDTIDGMAKKLIAHRVPVCTTLGFADVMAMKLSDPEKFLALPDIRFCTDRFVAAFRAGKEKDQVRLKGMEAFLDFYRSVCRLFFTRLYRAGVCLVLGTDAMTYRGNISGISVHRELECLAGWGLTPYQAIALGTVNASNVAAAMTGRNEFGTVEAGKRADLLLVAKNPLQDIRNVRKLVGVMAAGKWHTKTELDEMIAADEKHKTRKPASIVLMKIIEENGMDAAVAEYWKSKDPRNVGDRLDVGFDQMSALGYALIEKGETAEALKIFELLREAYPDDYDPYASLGDACLSAGDRHSAVYYFNRALRLNPLNESTRMELLEKLKKSMTR